MRVLISGASIAGPVLAYWLTRRGFDVTVVERAPALRKTGGHAVDLFGPAVDISERMGVLPVVMNHSTGANRLVLQRRGARRGVAVDYHTIFTAMSNRHVEIMRDDLSEIYYDAGRQDVDYRFGDHIATLTEDGDVTFAGGGTDRYDLVIGADGLHSGVRNLLFGDEAALTDFLGAYLAVISVPKSFAHQGDSDLYVDVDRVAGVYTADHLEDARALFMFRADPLDYHHRDTARQRALLQERFTGLADPVEHWLAELDRTPSFYFDAITQLQLSTWSRGRVCLVGDAGYCPGPAVGGSTSLAVLGAYVLAGELGRADGDHTVAYPAYQRVMTGPVDSSRGLARGMAKHFVPGSPLGVRSFMALARLTSLLPPRVIARAVRANDKGLGIFEAMHVPEYPLPVG